MICFGQFVCQFGNCFCGVDVYVGWDFCNLVDSCFDGYVMFDVIIWQVREIYEYFVDGIWFDVWNYV